MVFNYVFPANKRAVSSTVWEQSSKVLEEAAELSVAVKGGEPVERVLDEAMDVIQAVEGLLRKFNTSSVADAYMLNKQKGYQRSDYEEERC